MTSRVSVLCMEPYVLSATGATTYPHSANPRRYMLFTYEEEILLHLETFDCEIITTTAELPTFYFYQKIPEDFMLEKQMSNFRPSNYCCGRLEQELGLWYHRDSVQVTPP